MTHLRIVETLVAAVAADTIPADVALDVLAKVRLSVMCPRACGWTRDYSRRDGAIRGCLRHLSNDCGQVGGRGSWQTERALVRDRASVVAAGLALDVTEEQWVNRWDARPELLDDLLRVLGGTSTRPISRARLTKRLQGEVS